MRALWMGLALLVCASAGFAADIVTMPTANQLKQGEVDLAAYYIALDYPAPAPQFIQYQTLYLGLTDWLELDVHHANVDKDEDSTVLVASAKVLSETQTLPDVVVGCRNIGRTPTTLNPAVREKSKDPSYFICTAKTFFCNPAAPGPPLFRLHLSYGSEDWTLFNDERHDGFFGGIQMLFAPEYGMVIQHDGEDIITGLTWMPKNTGLTVKAGSYGEHFWMGLAFCKDLW